MEDQEVQFVQCPRCNAIYTEEELERGCSFCEDYDLGLVD